LKETVEKPSFTVKYSCLCGVIGYMSRKCSKCGDILTEETTSKVRVCNGCGHVYDFLESVDDHKCPPPK
jgi:hypothetical protein